MTSISGVNGSLNGAWAAVQAQRSQHQAKMFAKVDADGNGSVNQSELDTMLSDISQKAGVSFGNTKELFSKMDTNADGSLSSDELKDGMKQLMPPPPSTMEFANTRRQEGVDGQGSEADDLFSKVDSNSDGAIDASELKTFAEKIKSDTGQDVSDKLSKLDTDGDDKVSKTEFNAARPVGPEGGGTHRAHGPQGAGGPPPAGGPGGAQSTSASSSTTYDPLDTNKDGTVSEMERLAGALKELAQAAQSDGSGSKANSEIAKLAQKLYDQISANLLKLSDDPSLSALA